MLDNKLAITPDGQNADKSSVLVLLSWFVDIWKLVCLIAKLTVSEIHYDMSSQVLIPIGEVILSSLSEPIEPQGFISSVQ